MIPDLTEWIPLLRFVLEWAALALFAAGCVYWERTGASGIGIEGCAASAMLGLILGHAWTGSYPGAAAAAVAGALAFALAAGILLPLFRADPTLGSFALSLVPVCALGLLVRSGPFLLTQDHPAPGTVRGTVFEGTPAEELIMHPMLWAAPLVLAVAGWLLWQTPFGLRLRAFGEAPALRVPGASAGAYRMGGLAIGALCAVPGAALLLVLHGENPPAGLGFLALVCVVAGRWAFVPSILLAIGPALLRAGRPYAEAAGVAIVSEIAPFLLGLLYLAILCRRSLRFPRPRQTRIDPDVL